MASKQFRIGQDGTPDGRRPRRWAVLALLLGLVLGLGGTAQAEPARVVVGTYINQITGMDIRAYQVTVDFYVWFRWEDESINPVETFELMNGKIESRAPVPPRKIKGMNYGSSRVLAVVNQPWDVRHFPLDRQTIDLVIEDSDADEGRIVYQADTENTAFNPEIALQGYRIEGSAAGISDHVYRTNYGDISLPKDKESVFSRFRHTIEIARPDRTYFIKMFSSVFISVFVAFLAFLVKPVDLDPRFGLGVGALFAVVASYFVISSEMPRGGGFTLADQLNIVAMLMIFLSLLQSAISLMIYERNPERSHRLDRESLIGFPIAYILLSAIVVLVG